MCLCLVIRCIALCIQGSVTVWARWRSIIGWVQHEAKRGCRRNKNERWTSNWCFVICRGKFIQRSGIAIWKTLTTEYRNMQVSLWTKRHRMCFACFFCLSIFSCANAEIKALAREPFVSVMKLPTDGYSCTVMAKAGDTWHDYTWNSMCNFSCQQQHPKRSIML